MKNTNINRPEISSEEINSAKNFDKLYSSYAKTTKPFYKKNWFIANSVILVATGIIVSLLLLNNTETNQPANQIAKTEPNVDLVDIIVEENNELETPFVNPPIKGINVPFSSYTIHSGEAKTIKHKSGSLINIPKNTFVDENGNLVKGKVEIKYREFKDAAEIFASGISMTYKDNGDTFYFESAGMIEIQAYQDGKAVFISPKKKIDIEMTSDYAGTKYNLYSLDTINRNWVYEGKDKIVEKSLSDEVKKINEASQKSVLKQVETVAFSNIPPNPENNSELKNIQEEIVVIQEDIKKIKKDEPEKPVEATEKRFRFNLDVNPKEFPEMAVYKGLEFEIGKENKDFDPKLTNKEWNDISLSRNKKEKYILTLKRFLSGKEIKTDKKAEAEETRSFIVYPVYVGQNYTDAMKDFSKKYDEYSKKLADRKEDERIKQEEYEKKLAEIAKENEKRRLEWEATASIREKTAESTSQLYRTFSVARLGTYNCDSPSEWPKGQTVLASFIDGSKNKLDIATLYLIDKSKNAYFNYSYKDKFKFNPNTKNILIGVTANNQIITFSYEQFRAIPKDVKEYDFEMKVQPSSVNNIKELKQCISFL